MNTQNPQPNDKQASRDQTYPSHDFSSLPESIQAHLREQGIERPTPIQQQAIEPALAGRDLLGQSQTGSGKTLAFALPVGIQLQEPSDHGRPRALVLTPTRELAIQVESVFSSVLRSLSLRCMNVIGGTSYRRQIHLLRDGVDVVVGTPGRIVDLLEQNILELDLVQCFILDEVDQMLDFGFAEELTKLKRALPSKIQTLFFSATMNPRMQELAQQLLQDPIILNIAPQQSSPRSIQHAYIPVQPRQELPALLNVLLFHHPSQALIFCETRQDCREVSEALERRGFNASPLNGDLSQDARLATMKRFRDGSLQYLVATNVAARGLDIQGLPLVINYDVPFDTESYTHRTGRTGRAGEIGKAWTMITPRNFRRYWGQMRQLKLDPERLEVPSQRQTLAQIAQREIQELYQHAEEHPVRNIRRICDQLLQDLPHEDAMRLLRGFVYRQLARNHACDTWGVAATEDDLKPPPRDNRRDKSRKYSPLAERNQKRPYKKQKRNKKSKSRSLSQRKKVRSSTKSKSQ